MVSKFGQNQRFESFKGGLLQRTNEQQTDQTVLPFGQPLQGIAQISHGTTQSVGTRL